MNLRSVSTSMNARAMVASDVVAIQRLLSILPDLYPSGDRWLDHRLQDVQRGSAGCRVVTVDGQVAGVAIVTPKVSATTKLSTFYVAPWARMRGVGATLIDDVLCTLDQAENSETYVTVAHHVAKPLVKLLQPRGFTPVALEANRYGQGRHELILSRIVS